jgi:hypothetical protein
MVCGAKRMRSLYLPSPGQRPPGLSTRTPLKGPASVFTVNAATMRVAEQTTLPHAVQSRLEAAPTRKHLGR